MPDCEYLTDMRRARRRATKRLSPQWAGFLELLNAATQEITPAPSPIKQDVNEPETGSIFLKACTLEIQF